MTPSRNWDIEVDVDAVLRGQGAQADVVRKRSPRLVDLAEKALDEALPLIDPQVYQRRFKVDGLKHERLNLEMGRGSAED